MNDELILFGDGLDQPIRTKDEKVLDTIRAAILRAKEEKNIDIAIDACSQLVSIVKMSGRGLAEGLWMIWKNWDCFSISDDPIDYIYQRVGLHRATVERYIRVAEMLNNPDEYHIPAELVEEIGQRNIKELIPISTALAQGYDITEKQWQKIAIAPDYNTVANIVREEVKKVGARTNIVVIRMDRDGNIFAYDNSGVYVAIGYLELDRPETISQKAIERIVSNAGILRA